MAIEDELHDETPTKDVKYVNLYEEVLEAEEGGSERKGGKSMEMMEWRTSHFGCCSGDDYSVISILMSVLLYPCSIANAITESVEHPDGMDCCCLCTGICCSYCLFFNSGAYTHFRKQYNIKGTEFLGSTLCCDCLYSSCCGLCMSCQLQNQSRGQNSAPHPTNRNPTMQPWTTSFFDAGDNVLGLLYSFLCPQCAFAQLGAKFAGTPVLYECCCGNPFLMRYNMRHHWNIEPTPCGCCGDCCLLCMCPCFGYTQMKAEVDAKGPMFPEEDTVFPRFPGIEEPFF